MKLWLKIFQQPKVQTKWLHRWILSKFSRRANTHPSQTLPKNCRKRITPKLILLGHHHPNTKTRQRYYKKRKLQTNITDEYTRKNPQQITSKLNPIIPWKDHISWSSGIYPRDARTFQYPQVTQCDTPHLQIEE